jgi:hypothetical protein
VSGCTYYSNGVTQKGKVGQENINLEICKKYLIIAIWNKGMRKDCLTRSPNDLTSPSSVISFKQMCVGLKCHVILH